MGNKIERSVSITLDRGNTIGCIEHNARDTFPDHADPTRTGFNKKLCAVPLAKAYSDLFEHVIKEHIERTKKRGKAKLLNSLEYMQRFKKPYREIIVMIGNMYDTPADSEIGKKAAEILVAYYEVFVARNPYLYVIDAHLHMDEATPHLHIDFIPWGEGYENWLSRRMSFARALKMQGFENGTRGYSVYMRWVESEKQALGEIMERFGFEWVDLGTHEQHRNIHVYKHMELEKDIANLEHMKEDLKADIMCLMDGQVDVRSIERYRGELQDKLERDPEYQLTEPTGLMSAKKYMYSVAAPLFERFRKLLRDLVERLIKAKAALTIALNEKAELERTIRDLKRENNILMRQLDNEKQRSKDLSLLKESIGYDNADRILKDVKARKKGTTVKKHDYYTIDR